MTKEEIESEIEKVKSFREANKDKCVSTTHSWVFDEFLALLPALKREFGYLRIVSDDKSTKVTIPINCKPVIFNC